MEIENVINDIGLKIHEIFLKCKKSPHGVPFLSKEEALKFRELLTSLVQQSNEEDKHKLLTDYTNFLCKYNYTDSDVWSEEPKAVDRFLESLDK